MTTTKQTVYVVGYDPIENRASVGGFDWFWDKDKALNEFVRLAEENTHMLWFRTHETGHDVDLSRSSPSIREAITNEIGSLISWYGSNGDWNNPVPPDQGDPEGDMTPP